MKTYKNFEELKENVEIKEGQLYTIILINIRDYYSICKEADPKDIELIKFSIQNVASDMLNKDYTEEIFAFKSLEGIGFVITFLELDNDEDEIITDTYNATYSLIDKLESIMTNEYIASISKISDQFKNIEQIYDIAQDLISHDIIEPDKKVFIYEKGHQSDEGNE